jgi:hypothetical protein
MEVMQQTLYFVILLLLRMFIVQVQMVLGQHQIHQLLLFSSSTPNAARIQGVSNGTVTLSFTLAPVKWLFFNLECYCNC